VPVLNEAWWLSPQNGHGMETCLPESTLYLISVLNYKPQWCTVRQLYTDHVTLIFLLPTFSVSSTSTIWQYNWGWKLWSSIHQLQCTCTWALWGTVTFASKWYCEITTRAPNMNLLWYFSRAKSHDGTVFDTPMTNSSDRDCDRSTVQVLGKWHYFHRVWRPYYCPFIM